MEPEERAAFFPRISFSFSFSSFSSFSFLGEGGNRPRTFNDPTLVNPSSYSYAHSTARRKQEAHAGRSPEHCRGTHHQSAKRARPPKGTRERQKIFASRIGRHGVLCPFVFDTASTQHPQSSSGMASSSCHCWPTLPVGSGHSGCLFPKSVFFFPTNNNNKNNHSSCQPPPPPTHPRPPVLGLCQQQQQGASMGRTVSDSCWSATDPAGPALLGSSTK